MSTRPMESAALGETGVVVVVAFLRTLPCRTSGGGGGIPLRDLPDSVDFPFDLVELRFGAALAPFVDVTSCVWTVGVAALPRGFAGKPL